MSMRACCRKRLKPGSLWTAADAPKEWADLFDPKWKGKVAINPPWRSVSVQQIVAFWEDNGIPDPAEKLKANDVRFFEGSGGIIQAVLRSERQHLLEQARSELSTEWARLIGLLTSEPPTPYETISDVLGMPIGSIGPTRGRCLAQMARRMRAAGYADSA